MNRGKSIEPNDTTLSLNSTVAAEANEQCKNNRTGPLAAFINSMALWPLSVVSNKSDDIAASVLAQDPPTYLPNGTHPTVIVGYASQLKVLAR